MSCGLWKQISIFFVFVNSLKENCTVALSFYPTVFRFEMKDEKGKIGKECLKPNKKKRRRKKNGLSVPFKKELSKKESTDEEVTKRSEEAGFQKEDSTLYIERKLHQIQDSDLQKENDRLKKQLFRKEFEHFVEVTDLQMKIENQEQQIKIKTREINDLRSRLFKEKEKWIEKEGTGFIK